MEASSKRCGVRRGGRVGVLLKTSGIPDTCVFSGRVILTDDPLRVKMLAAHHLEHAELLYEQGDTLVYDGYYNGSGVALVAAGFACGALPGFMREANARGVTEVIYMGTCAAPDGRDALRTVVLAEGGSQSLLKRARAAAERCGITALTGAALPREAAQTERCGITALTGAALPREAAQSERVRVFDGVTAEIYELAAVEGVEALAVLTITENIQTGESMEEHERRSRLYAAARLAFEIGTDKRY